MNVHDQIVKGFAFQTALAFIATLMITVHRGEKKKKDEHFGTQAFN